MDEYSTIAKMEFPDPKLFEAELVKLREEHEAQDQKHADNVVEAEKERRTQADAAMHAEMSAQALGLDFQPKGKKKKTRKDAGGPSEQVLGISPEDYEEMRRREEEANTW